MRLLLVEDEEAIALPLQLNLKLEGYHVVWAKDGKSALEKFREQAFDIAILDVMLPHLDGFSLCETIRLEGITTPVLFLSAKNTPRDRVEGLRIGGDDYLTKPFELEELLLRLTKLVQRHQQRNTIAELQEYRFDGGYINFLHFSITDRHGKNHEITKREMMLLKLLISRKDEVVSREEILEKIWGYDVYPSTRTIDNFILAFRRHFEADSRNPRHFHSVRGVGYRYTD